MNASTSSRASRITTILLLAVALLAAIATSMVIASDIPPVFNQSQRGYRLINLALVTGLLAVCATLVYVLLTDRLQWIASALKLLAVGFLALNLSLLVFDRTVISVDGSRLAGAFRNVQLDGEELVLHQSTPTSPFGFDAPVVEPRQSGGYRVLFLGNSYLRGLGSAGAPSYPRAVDAMLKKELGRDDISVFSAGTSGAGIRDDLFIYKLLLQQGYKFDAVVLNVMMQSDLTNNIPGTMRAAVAGQPQRFHDSVFLRYFYPINSTLFRYLVYFKVRFWQQWAADDGPKLDATCKPSASFADFVRERANSYYGAAAKRSVFLDYNVDQALRINGMAKARGTRMLAVLLPDPNSELDSYRDMFKGQSMDWEWTRSAVNSKLAAQMPVLDLAPEFRNDYASYRCNDTHWTARGNREGGQRVGKWLATEIGSDLPEAAIAKQVSTNPFTPQKRSP